LFHGGNDRSVPSWSSVQFARALQAVKVPVELSIIPGKTHTDFILEDPILGRDLMAEEIIRIVWASQYEPHVHNNSTAGRMLLQYPPPLVHLARIVNPF
jgi:prenylcysteine alpha-carboxyl methylesterase